MTVSDALNELMGSLRPEGVPPVPCSDCDWSVDGKTVVHGAMCAIAMCIEDVTQADRRWFEKHPFADQYYREITWGEGAEILLRDERAQELAQTCHLTVMGKVCVNRIRDDVRMRRFDDVYYVIEGERVDS